VDATFADLCTPLQNPNGASIFGFCGFFGVLGRRQERGSRLLSDQDVLVSVLPEPLALFNRYFGSGNDLQLKH
jgi:hypothetical protein